MTWTDNSYDDDSDGPQEQDLDAFGEAANEDLPPMICPNCRKVVTEDTQKCPYCGDWITPEYPSRLNWRRWVFFAVILLMLYGILRFTFF